MEGVTITHMQRGTDRYRRYCDATGKLKTEYVMQGSRFYGSGREYENEWAIPKQPKSLKTDQVWIDAGKEKGVEPRAGESMAEFKHRLGAFLR